MYNIVRLASLTLGHKGFHPQPASQLNTVSVHRNELPLRANSTCYQLLGMFPEAHVAPLEEGTSTLFLHMLTGM